MDSTLAERLKIGDDFLCNVHDVSDEIKCFRSSRLC